MLARLQAGVEQIPQLWPLGLGLPLAKTIAVAEDALFGAGFFFVTACAANQRVKAEFFNSFEQRDRLVHIAALTRVGQAHRATPHRVFDAAHNQFGTQLLGAKVAEIGHLGEVVTGVDHQQGVGDAASAKGLFGAFQHDQ
jgi:hypothetical protein